MNTKGLFPLLIFSACTSGYGASFTDFQFHSNIGMLSDLSPKERLIFEKLCGKFELDAAQITVKKCSLLQKNYHTQAFVPHSSLLLFDENIKELSEQEFSFLLCHELTHIKYHDSPKEFFAFLGSILTSFLSLHLLAEKIIAPQSMATSAISLVCTIAFSLWTSLKIAKRYARYHETRADLIAIKKLNTAAGAIAWLNHNRQENLLIKQAFLEKGQSASVDQDGNNTADQNHPLLTERIAAIETCLSQQAS
jgi:Zn-dependent protease with chaperone function